MKLEPDRIFVRDGNIWSSAGITAGIDLALAMVAEDYGEEIAQQTARQLVLYHRRSGGQSQFSSLLELKAPPGRFGPLLAWAREHLDAPLTVEDLAEQAGMSSRHFARAFIARDRHHAVEGGGAAADRGGAAARAILQRGDRARRARPPAFAIRSGCAAPSSAPSASRRNRCGGRRGRAECFRAKWIPVRVFSSPLKVPSLLPAISLSAPESGSS